MRETIEVVSSYVAPRARCAQFTCFTSTKGANTDTRGGGGLVICRAAKRGEARGGGGGGVTL